jgi:capsid protein
MLKFDPIKAFRAFINRWEATQYNSQRNSLNVTIGGADAKTEYTTGDRKKLLKLSRHLRNNLGVTAGLITDISRYSVGSDTMAIAATDDDEWNDAANAYFEKWEEQADATGKFSLGQLVDVWCQSMQTDGDVFIVKTESNGVPVLQTIYGHAVDGDSDGYIDGIKYDKLGRPLRYMIGGKPINARGVIHVFEPRPNVLRGVPKIAHAANNLFDLRDIVSFEKQGVKVNSAIAAVLQRANPSGTTGNRFLGRANSTVSDGSIITVEQLLGGGNMPIIPIGDTFTQNKSDRTGANFVPFLEFLLRDVCVGFEIPYEFAWSSEKLTGPAQRFVIGKADRRFRQIRITFERALTEVWRYVIATAIARGELPANPQFDRVEWVWPATASIDLGRESREDRENIKAGLMTLKEYFAEDQKHWKKELLQRKREEEFLRANGMEARQAENLTQQETQENT